MTTQQDALRKALEAARMYVASQNGAEHMLDGFGGRKPRPSDADLAAIDAALEATAEPEQPVAWTWRYIGPDPLREHIKPVARALHEMDPHNPPYKDTWQPVGPLYASPQVQAKEAAATLHKEDAKERERAAILEWQPIETAPEGVFVVVMWRDAEDAEHPERHDLDWLEDGCWVRHHENREHFVIAATPGSRGPSEKAPYTHWMPLPAAPSPENKHE